MNSHPTDRRWFPISRQPFDKAGLRLSNQWGGLPVRSKESSDADVKCLYGIIIILSADPEMSEKIQGTEEMDRLLYIFASQLTDNFELH